MTMLQAASAPPRGKIETFKPLILGPKGFNSLGIPGLGERPAMARPDAELAAMLADFRPESAELRRKMRGLEFGLDTRLAPRIDEMGDYHSPNRADATASAYFTPMNNLTANLGGQVQNLPAVWQMGARERVFGGTLTYAAQASGTVIGLCRLPLFGAITGITLITSVSTGSATLAIGDANSANVYVAAAAYTTADTPQRIGKTAAHFSQLTQGYDATTGAVTNYGSSQTDPQTAAPQSSGFGGLYEDVLVTTAAASLPGSGTLVILIEYVMD